MRRERKLSKMVISLSVVGATTAIATAQEIQRTTLDTVGTHDIANLHSFRLDVQIEQDVSWVFRDQGRYSEKCSVCRRGNSIAITCEADVLPDPVYRSPGTGEYSRPDYDSNGRLIINMPLRQLVLYTLERNEAYQEWESIAVAPNGDSASTGVVRVHSLYPPTDKWRPPKLRQILWALGQGMGSSFGQLEHEGVDKSGQQQLRARGTADHGSLKGEWNLLVESSDSHLIRNATFQLDSLENSPGTQIETTGTRRFGNVFLPQRGTLRTSLGTAGHLLRRVEVLDFASEIDGAAFAKVQAKLDQDIFAGGGELTEFDYRGNPSKPKIKRRESQ